MIQKDLENSVICITAFIRFFFQIYLNKLSAIFVLLYAALPRAWGWGNWFGRKRACAIIHHVYMIKIHVLVVNSRLFDVNYYRFKVIFNSEQKRMRLPP